MSDDLIIALLLVVIFCMALGWGKTAEQVKFWRRVANK